MTGAADPVGAPEHLETSHNLSAFESGVPSLDDWLKRRALANEESGASRTYVVSAGGRVIGYYALATGAVEARVATGRTRRNMPDPIPVMIIGRLAVDRAYQEKGLGRALLRDAILRTLQAASIGGIRAILVHAISDEELLRRVSLGIARAESHGLTWDASITAFVAMMFEVAPTFDEQPAIARVLKDESLPADQRIDALWERTTDEDWDEAEARAPFAEAFWSGVNAER